MSTPTNLRASEDGHVASITVAMGPVSGADVDGREARPGRVLCLGETMALVTPIDVAPLQSAASFAIKPGGAESTVAMYLADSGIAASWVSLVGDDPLGRRLLDEISANGVDVSGVGVVEWSPTGVYFKDPGDGRTTVHYYRSGSAASTMDERMLGAIDWMGVTVLHVTGITAGLSPGCSRMLEAIMREARGRGLFVSFDVNYRPGLWGVDAAGPRLAELATLADLVFVGRDEAETLWGMGAPVPLFERLGVPGRLIVKDGDVGATEVERAHGELRTEFVASRTVEVVEAVGAGDAFTAGYLDALLRGATAEERLDRGHDLAARTLGSTHDFVPA
ncbi:MAG: sugar kinase [Pseudoclavibacter sp.]